MEQRFTNIYKNNEWNEGSGGGSTIEFNKDTYNPFLINFIKDNNITSVVDAACGDWQSSYLIYEQLSNVQYDGYDIVKFLMENNQQKFPMYNFHHLDMCTNPEQLKPADLLILKDVIQHWSTNQMVKFLDQIISMNKYKFILICNSCNQNRDYNLDDITDRPLSCDYFPLNKYKPEKLYMYNDKEVSVIYM